MAMIESGKIMIVGCGPGSPDYLSCAARAAIGRASVLVGAPHLLDSYAVPPQERIPVGSDIDAVLETIASRLNNGKIVILVTGDPGLCSFAAPVLRRFGKDACEVIPGISSVQLAFARLGLDWRDARILSAHKGLPDSTPADLSAFGSVVILSGHSGAQKWIADLARGFENDRILVVCEDLSFPGERIRQVSATRFRQLTLSTRTIVLLLRKEDFSL